MKNEFKGSKGKVVAGQKLGNSDGSIFHVAVDDVNEPAAEICTLYGSPNDSLLEAEANANLIAEAFNVVNETGLTPKQLAEQNKEVLNALVILQHRMELLINSTPTGEFRNQLTEENILALTAIKNAEQ